MDGFGVDRSSVTVICNCPGPPFSRFSATSGPCGFRKLLRPPSLPGNDGYRLLLSIWKGHQPHAPGLATAQTAHFAAGVFAAAPLDSAPLRQPTGVRRILSFPRREPA